MRDFKACFLLGEDEVDTVEIIMSDIRAKDETFRYKIRKRKEGGYVLVIYDSDMDRLHRRAMWVSHRALNGRLYWISKRK